MFYCSEKYNVIIKAFFLALIAMFLMFKKLGHIIQDFFWMCFNIDFFKLGIHNKSYSADSIQKHGYLKRQIDICFVILVIEKLRTYEHRGNL